LKERVSPVFTRVFARLAFIQVCIVMRKKSRQGYKGFKIRAVAGRAVAKTAIVGDPHVPRMFYGLVAP
jgi:hypothetical protein